MKLNNRMFMQTARNVSIVFIAGGMFCASWAGHISITDEFDFGTWSPFNKRLQKTVPVCIWDASASVSSYRIKATGFSSSGGFSMTSDTRDVVPYEVYWISANDAADRERLQSDVTSQHVLTFSDEVRCENGPSGLLYLSVDSTALEQVNPGVYSDTIELTISPL